MENYRLRAHVGQDGLLTLRVPTRLSETDVDVLVTVSERGKEAQADLGWPPGYFETTYGSFRDGPLVRSEQGQFEVREAQ